MLGRLFRRKQPPAAMAYGDLLTSPPDPPHGEYRGVIIARKERTWAGCVMMPDEAARMPIVLLLDLGGRMAPLKWLDEAREAHLIHLAGQYREPGGKPYPITEDPLLGIQDLPRLGAVEGDTVTLHGVAHPMYTTGTIVGIRVWGLYARPIG